MTDDTAAITELLHKYYDTLAWANGDRHRLWSESRPKTTNKKGAQSAFFVAIDK